jgi:hypothetical protein
MGANARRRHGKVKPANPELTEALRVEPPGIRKQKQHDTRAAFRLWRKLPLDVRRAPLRESLAEDLANDTATKPDPNGETA